MYSSFCISLFVSVLPEQLRSFFILRYILKQMLCELYLFLLLLVSGSPFRKAVKIDIGIYFSGFRVFGFQFEFPSV